MSTSSPSGRTLRWGAQLRADVIGSEQQAYRASGYMSKVINYVLKDVVAAGTDGDDEEMPCTPSPDEIARRSHIRRMTQAAHAWRCGRPGGGADGARHRRCCEAHNSRLQRSYRCRGGGHRSFGWHGRVFSTSRDWSPDRLSLTRCRRRRQDYCSRARSSVLGDSVVWRHASATSWSRDARRIRGEIERDPGTALAWLLRTPGHASCSTAGECDDCCGLGGDQSCLENGDSGRRHLDGFLAGDFRTVGVGSSGYG